MKASDIFQILLVFIIGSGACMISGFLFVIGIGYVFLISYQDIISASLFAFPIVLFSMISRMLMIKITDVVFLGIDERLKYSSSSLENRVLKWRNSLFQEIFVYGQNGKKMFINRNYEIIMMLSMLIIFSLKKIISEEKTSGVFNGLMYILFCISFFRGVENIFINSLRNRLYTHVSRAFSNAMIIAICVGIFIAYNPIMSCNVISSSTNKLISGKTHVFSSFVLIEDGGNYVHLNMKDVKIMECRE
ncbi:hypothetical protein P7L79_01480 (plasmid) [Tistrella mobilis]|uniref:hypothetical protein n=1 Tax=Tistrella mobilis TaxID=171437 RepID=UPI0035576469